MLNFDKKVVLVTGGNSGIGATTVDLFVKRGAKVISTDIAYFSVKPERINFEDNPVRIKLDVSNSAQVAEMIDLTVAKCGRLDVVVNSAGILTTKPILEISEEDWDRVFTVNLKGTFFVCQAALRHMIERNTGCIVNLSSVSGKIGGVMAGADYSASKAAVICLTKSLAKAGAPHGVRANSIAPAGINTPMVDQYHKKFPEKVKESIASKPLGRFGEAIEVSHTILFLASKEASYITGACVDVNGGMLMD